ncbi:MAG: DNA mismatch repair endonuclease MutL [Candidatus Omnitrophica bacterium]|nr:DNA mismatch repair endonuclease MutL [Candidatus Omnitrophota bacterium]
MPKVQVLSADVIARIAAGEVVERPASVVKELMENSLDAGAMKIEVNLTGGGKQLIQVKDNGGGIAREDMEALFYRHATSKLSSKEDLDNILSLGFRGEALYSVSSVAELALKSRAAGQGEAWEIKVHGGARQMILPAAMPANGTDIRVEELFFNTPARKKFLKSDHGEFGQAADVFLPYALLYPQKHLVLTHNGRVVYDLSPEGSGAARAARALALPVEHIITLDKTQQGEAHISGLLGDINVQRPRRDLQFVFVNGRPVQSKGLLFHLNDVYRLILPEGVHPFFVLYLEIPPQEVDVNIHPAKREVRIKDEARIGSMVRRAVEQALMTKGQAKEAVAVFPFEPGVMPADQADQGLAPGRLLFGPGQRSAVPAFVPRPASAAGAVPGHSVSAAPSRAVEPVKAEAQSFFAFTGQLAARRDDSLKERLLHARFLGTFICKYHLFEEGEGLFVVDQHAAQERILFELFTRQMRSGVMEVDRLLAPLVVRLSPRELLTWENLKAQLDALGFESALLGEGAVALQAHPRLIKAPEAAFRALLSDEDKAGAERPVANSRPGDALPGGGRPSQEFLAGLSRRACRASVMSGERMHSDEAREQLKRLMDCDDPFTCPHGRPVFIELKSSFLDRQFLRTS